MCSIADLVCLTRPPQSSIPLSGQSHASPRRCPLFPLPFLLRSSVQGIILTQSMDSESGPRNGRQSYPPPIKREDHSRRQVIAQDALSQLARKDRANLTFQHRRSSWCRATVQSHCDTRALMAAHHRPFSSACKIKRQKLARPRFYYPVEVNSVSWCAGLATAMMHVRIHCGIIEIGQWKDSDGRARTKKKRGQERPKGKRAV